MRDWLREIRGDKTQTEMATRAGIYQGFYSDIENGNKTPRPPMAKKIAKALDFDWTRFYEDEEQRSA